MPSFSLLVTCLAAFSVCQAHHVFVRLAHNGVWQSPLQYIRNKTAPYADQSKVEIWPREWNFPVFPDDFPTSVRCGRDSLAHANKTSTLKVKAGDTIEFVAWSYSPYDWDNPALAQWDNCPDGRGVCASYDPQAYGIGHSGPAGMYLSRVPAGEKIHTYDGSGEWVKIFTLGYELRNNTDNPIFWLPLGGTRMIATLPKQTPKGQYLLRVDQIWPGVREYSAQIYPSCAHIEVESEYAGDLPKGVKIPEIFSATSPGMKYDEQGDWRFGPPGYRYPGGLQWDGEKMAEVEMPKPDGM
ncbi:glycoside hydrolase [Dendryphion nanum]|uniref:lytic cellulose monooxygenase (C4-dehydrogenating) n=1 Tax=Dendryphion nanum TaxID=256645 RepID=A0A9P9IIN5_9PLEO|nr:glycoside hydrolase [Dendryphion nanum]